MSKRNGTLPVGREVLDLCRAAGKWAPWSFAAAARPGRFADEAVGLPAGTGRPVLWPSPIGRSGL